MSTTPSVLPAQGRLIDKTFTFPVRVYYEDTDAGGIVYYANYLKFAERARSEFLRFLDIDQQHILAQKHCGFIVRSCTIYYLSSAKLDDALTISCQVKELGGASAVIHQDIRCGENLLARLDVKIIYINLDTHRPTRIDAEIADKFTTLI